METMFLIFLLAFADTSYGLQTNHIKQIDNYTVCDFEQQNLCGFTQDEIRNADFNWTWYSGSTPSDATGPSADHTIGTSAGHYIYIEATSPKQYNKAARIMSPIYLPMNGGPHCVTFWYHMYGDDVNSLFVHKIAFDESKLIWTRSFDQGNTWKAASVTVKTSGIFQLLFEGWSGKGLRGDIAIDDVSVAKGACNDKDEHYVDCGFDYDLCGWTPFDPIINTGFDWERTSGNEPYMGPLGDHDGKRSFIYTRAEYPFLVYYIDMIKFLVSPLLLKTSEKGSCFSLRYHIPEKSDGQLNVYTRSFSNYSSSQLTLQWSTSGTQSKTWQQVALSIVESTSYKILIEVKFPKQQTWSFLQYTDLSVAIDDIMFKDTQCGSSSRKTQSGLQTIYIQTIDNYTVCDFEQQNMCGYTQEQKLTAQFNWTWHSGSTQSPGTGPSADHTKGTSAGHYMYIETSDPRKPYEAARILSHGYHAKSTGPLCVTFWYHMYGADVNTLNVYMFAKSDISAKSLIWTKSFNQGDEWKKAAVTVNPDGVFQLLFEGVRGGGFRGDIAIDDMSVAIGTCRAQYRGREICVNENCVPLSSVPCGSESVHFESREIRGEAKLQKYTIDQRTVGGSTAAPKEVPWQVGVRLNNKAWCGGAILGDFWVLSAAHCFSYGPKGLYTVRTGDLDNTVHDDHEEEFELAHIIKHPLYIGRPYDYDLALLKIKPNKGTGGIKFSEQVKPVCLPDKTDKTTSYAGQECLVSGWGKTSYNGSAPDKLQLAVVPLMDDATCKRLYKNTTNITPRMMCAGYREGRIDICSGDSGGGLVCHQNGHYTVMGVASFGMGGLCGIPDSPHVYANVQEFIPWILEQILAFS